MGRLAEVKGETTFRELYNVKVRVFPWQVPVEIQGNIAKQLAKTYSRQVVEMKGIDKIVKQIYLLIGVINHVPDGEVEAFIASNTPRSFFQPLLPLVFRIAIFII